MKLTPTLEKAQRAIFAKQVQFALVDAQSAVRYAEAERDYTGHMLKVTVDKQVWGADARKAERALVEAKKRLAFWKRAARDLKGSKP